MVSCALCSTANPAHAPNLPFPIARYDTSRLETSSRQDANGARNVSYYTSSAHSTPQSTPGNTLKKTSYSVTREFPVNQDPAAAALAGGLSKLTIERATARLVRLWAWPWSWGGERIAAVGERGGMWG